jgi:hypothetical protein
MVSQSAQGMPVARIAEVSFTSDDRVRDVIHDFNTDGVDSLYPKYSGGTKLADFVVTEGVCGVDTRVPCDRTLGVGQGLQPGEDPRPGAVPLSSAEQAFEGSESLPALPGSAIGSLPAAVGRAIVSAQNTRLALAYSSCPATSERPDSWTTRCRGLARCGRTPRAVDRVGDQKGQCGRRDHNCG